MFQGIRVPTWKKKNYWSNKSKTKNNNETKMCVIVIRYPPRVAPGWDTSGSTCVKRYFGNWSWSKMSNNQSLTDQSSEADKKGDLSKGGLISTVALSNLWACNMKSFKVLLRPSHLHLRPPSNFFVQLPPFKHFCPICLPLYLFVQFLAAFLMLCLFLFLPNKQTALPQIYTESLLLHPTSKCFHLPQ